MNRVTERDAAATHDRVAVVEIGGTKLQWGWSADGGETLEQLGRAAVNRSAGAEGILRTLDDALRSMIPAVRPIAIGIGFGGPVDPATGIVTTSHQVAGWDGFPLAEYFRQAWRLPVSVANDCNAAALAEATWGAGRGARRVFYVTVGTGIGGAMVVDGRLDGADRLAIAEIGHLRPGPDAKEATETVESWASGLGIARRAVAEAGLTNDRRWREVPAIVQAAEEGDACCQAVLDRATRTLGWAIASVITLLAPDIVVIGGGVTGAGERWFWQPLRQAVDRFVFPPLQNRFSLSPAALGDRVVLHGAGRSVAVNRSVAASRRDAESDVAS